MACFRLRPDAVTLILESLDRIKEILVLIEQNETEPQGDDSDLLARLELAAEGKLAHGEAGAPTAESSAADVAALFEAEAPVEAVEVHAPAPVAEKAKAAPAAGPQKPAGGTSVADQSIRVNVDVIEQLIVMVSELVLTAQSVTGDGSPSERQRIQSAVAAAVECDGRVAGKRHEDAHAADRECVGEAAAYRGAILPTNWARRSNCR